MAPAGLPIGSASVPWPGSGPAARDSVALRIDHQPIDSIAARTLRADLESGWAQVEAFFGTPLDGPVTVHLFPDRAALDAHFRETWGMESECWMVGGAEGPSSLVLLSPRVWVTQACDHDPSNPEHVRNLVTHELVHVFHMQRYGDADFDEGIGWLVEGIATLVSGQLDAGQRARAIEALEAGAVPARLAEAWSGPYRYGVAGSLVEYVDQRWGRDVLYSLLGAGTQDDVLSALGINEAQLLAEWRAWMSR